MKKSKSKSLTTNFIFNAIKTIMVVIFPLISFPYVSRVLGVEGLGNVNYAISIISYYGLVATLGIGSYAVREGVKIKGDRIKFSAFAKEIFTINAITTFIAYVALFISLYFNIFPGYNKILLACSLTIIFNFLSVEWIFQTMEEYVYISIRTIVFQFIALILMLLFIKNQNDTLLYAYITVFASGGYCVFNLINISKYVDFKVKHRPEIKKHIKPILIIFGTTVSVSIYMNLDIVMLGQMFGDYQVGLYTAAIKLNTIIKNIIVSASVVVLPRASTYIACKAYKEYKELLSKVANYNMMFSVPAAIGLACLSKNILLLFSGKEYLGAVFASSVLSLNIVFAAIDNIFYNQILIPNNKEKLACVGTIIGACTNLILNFFLIPLFALNGAAIATLISELIVFIFFVVSIRKIIDYKDIFGDVWKYLLSAAPVILISYVVNKYMSNYTMALALIIILSCVAYFIMLCLLRDKYFKDLVYSIKNKFRENNNGSRI